MFSKQLPKEGSCPFVTSESLQMKAKDSSKKLVILKIVVNIL